jgi:hypothetical protein
MCKLFQFHITQQTKDQKLFLQTIKEFNKAHKALLRFGENSNYAQKQIEVKKYIPHKFKQLIIKGDKASAKYSIVWRPKWLD